MKILLLGEYSNVHNTLAEGLRQLGHEVTVMSNGDFWKRIPSDVDLSRQPTFKGKLSFVLRLFKALRRMRGYDVVQLINPMFLEVKAERLFRIYDYLRRHNRKVVLAVMGDDYYYPYVNRNLRPMRHSDYNIGTELRSTPFAEATYNDWVGTTKERLNKYIAADCDAIVAGAYEYWLPYTLAGEPDWQQKISYIPFPVKIPQSSLEILQASLEIPQSSLEIPQSSLSSQPESAPHPLMLFVGISSRRSAFKGTDILLRAAQDLLLKYPDRFSIRVAEGLPYQQYQQQLLQSDVLLDQLYAYGPGMNALLALSHGIICLTGGEPEHYDLLGEEECRPIVRVEPSYQSVFDQLETLILHPERIVHLKRQSALYVARHYDYLKVAQQYQELYASLLGSE